MDVVGTPGSLLKIEMAPSVPVYARRGSLLCTFGSIDAFASTLSITRPIARLLSRQPVIYQKHTSVLPVTSLMSCSQAGKSTFSVITLDGSIDWVVIAPGGLHAYSGEALTVLPRSRWSLRRPKSAPSLGHVLISGRGDVALASAGHTFQVRLAAGESLLVQRKSLVAYSVDSNAAPSRAPEPYHLRHNLAASGPQPTGPSSSVATTSSSGTTGEATQSTALRLWKSIIRSVRSYASWISTSVKSDSTAFLEMHGPTTLLLQTEADAPVSLPALSLPGSGAHVDAIESRLAQRASESVSALDFEAGRARHTGMAGDAEHHLKIATIVDGKVVFTSARNFDEFTK